MKAEMQQRGLYGSRRRWRASSPWGSG